MTDYLRLAQERAPQALEEQDNPYLSLAQQQQTLQQNRARTVIESALKDDPDIAAERLRLSQTSGVPLNVVERNLQELRIKERARAVDLVTMAQESPVLYRQLVDPTFATTSVDDLDTLKNIERSVGKSLAYVMGADAKGGLPSDIVGLGKDVGLGYAVGTAAMAFDVAGTLNDLIGWQSGAQAARSTVKRLEGVMDRYGSQGTSSTEQAIRSGARSAGTSLALLPIGLIRNLYATANQAASTVAGLMATGVGAGAYNKAREQGLNSLQSAVYAIPEGTFEYVFERIPAAKLFGDLAANTGLLRLIGRQTLSEGWTEQVTTLAQDFNEWMNLNQDKTLAEFIQERPEAAYQTFIATLVGVGVQTSTIKGINKIVEAASNQALTFEQDLLQQQLQLAAASTLRARSPEQFRTHIQRVVDANEGAKSEIYVDAEVLNQLPQELLAQLPESVREALPGALETNSTVAIPMADVLTVAPGTELEQILNDNARMRPNAPSRVEAQLTEQFLQQEAERVLQQAADQTAWQQSSQAVQQTILDQLNTAGRFTPDVNEAYATLQANFFSTMAARVGLTPQQLYDRYQLRVSARQPGGQVLNAGIPAPSTLTMPNVPTVEDMQQYSRTESVPLSKVVSFQSARNWDRFNANQGPGALVEGYGDKPLALRLETGEYVIYDGNHRTDLAIQNGETAMDMYVIDVKSYDPAHAGRKPVPPAMGSDELLAALFEQSQQAPRLMAINNLSADNLLFADRMGGIAVPSIGVVTDQAGGVDGFGEITLLGTRDMADPRNEPVFSSDAYTARFPSPEWPKVKSKDAMRLVEEVRAAATEFDDRSIVSMTFDEMVNSPNANKVIERWIGSLAAQAMFLREQGVDVQPVMRPVRLESGLTVEQFEQLRPLLDAVIALEREGRAWDQSPEAQQLVTNTIGFLRTNFAALGKRDVFIRSMEEKVAENPLWLLRRDRDAADSGPTVDTYETTKQVRPLIDERAAEFKQWVEGKVLPKFGDPFLKVGGKRVPYTLDNIVKVMTGPKVRGQEKTMTYGAGQVRAASSVQFSDLEQMREAAQQAIKDPAEYNAAKEQSEALLDAYRTAVVEFTRIRNWRGEPDTWEALDGSMRALAKWATGKKRDAASLKAALRAEDFDTARIPDEVIAQGIEAGNALLNAPVPYFEAKPQRAVQLNEFAGAVIPENASAQVREVLERNGIPFVEYAEQGQRAQVARDFAAQLSAQGSDTLFQSGLQNGAVTLRALADEGNSEAILAQSLVDGLGLGPQELADVLVGVAGLSESDRLGSVPALQPVLTQMRRAILNSPQILDAVVGSVPVDVVNNLAGSQDAAKVLLNDQAVLEDSPAFNAELPVTLPVDTAGAASLFVREAAVRAAELARVTLGARLETQEGGAAMGARQGDGLSQGQSFQQGPRATFSPSELLITLNENADLSSFLHESGHFFLEVLADLASQPNTPQQIKDDMAATLKWFGIKGDEQVGGTDSGAPLAQQEDVDAIYREMAADQELLDALDTYRVVGDAPEGPLNDRLLSYLRRLPPVSRNFYRNQPSWAKPWERGWASWTINKDQTRFFGGKDFEVVERPGGQGLDLGKLGDVVSELTGEYYQWGSQGEWLLLNESVGFAQGGNLPTDTTQPAGRTPLDVWNAMTLDQKRPYHERWAESFEQYLFEGKAPNQELQPLFRRFRSWLVNVYQSLTAFMRGRNLKVSDEIRQVFDRLVATDEQIAQAEEAAGMLPDFEATNEAIEALQARSLRDLKWTIKARSRALKALEKEAATLRKEVEAEVRAEVEQQPLYKAMNWLKKGETTDPETGDLVKAEKGYRLSTAALAEMYPETMLGRPDLTRLRGMTGKEGLHPDMVADMFGFESGDQLVRAILDAEPIASVIEGITDQRMLERHGDLATPEAREAAANEAVHNEARARSLATELKSQAEMMNQRQDTGRTATNGRAITVNAVVEAAKQFALNLAARRRLKDLKNAAWQHRSAEARAGKRWQQLTAEGKTEEAVQAKRDQLLNNYAAKALQDAQVEVRKTLEFFKRITKGSDEKIVERGRDPDVVNAMRAILAAYDVAPRLEKSALAYVEVVAKNDPAMYSALKPGVDAALLNAKPLTELTLEELRGLNDELRAMWVLAKRSRQMEVDGNLLDIEEAADELVTRMDEIGIPVEIPGERGAITDKQEAGIKLRFALSILTRVEQWAERLDGRFGGPFLRLVFQPVKDAADRYRTDKVAYRKQFVQLLETVKPFLPAGPIAAPELGYTFGNARDSGAAELLHAILHTGNDSNKRKLLLGRGWATQSADGTLDTTRWDAFIERLQNDGVLVKAHYDFAQGVWDLLEQMKPLAQETHRKVFGRYFAEVTANEFTTPFGTYRGGYVPAQTDSRLVKDAKLRELAEGENESMAYAFPAAPSGFTKSRVEYNQPLLLDLRALSQHMDKVLLFSHMQGAVTDVRRLLTNKRVSYALDRIDPGAYEGMLIPWLNRAAKQVVETPVVGDRKLSRFLSAARSRAGMALMFANLSNTFQQITGFSMAAVKVKPGLMLQATAAFIADPKGIKRTVAEASPYMKDRMLNEVSAMNDAVEEILVNPTLLQQGQAWTQRHAYFMQAAVDNTMSPIIWTAAYNQATAEGQNERDAVRFADSVVRQTQGTTLPEDVSRFETGPGYARLFTQFVSYFNMMANTNATAVSQIVNEMGLRKGAGRLLYVALAGLLVPIWVAEAIAQAFRGGPEDEEGDGWLDDWLMAVFGLGTIRGLVAQVPIAGQAAQLVVNRFNDNPADDKFSLSPAVSLIESAVSSPASVYKAVVDGGSAQKAVRDVATAATLITGLPIFTVGRPLGYLAGLADERIEPTGPVDLARGLVTGTASPESKQR